MVYYYQIAIGLSITGGDQMIISILSAKRAIKTGKASYNGYMYHSDGNYYAIIDRCDMQRTDHVCDNNGIINASGLDSMIGKRMSNPCAA